MRRFGNSQVYSAYFLPITCILLMQLAELDFLQKSTAKLPPSQKQQRILAPALSNKCFFMSVTSSAPMQRGKNRLRPRFFSLLLSFSHVVSKSL